MIKQKWLIEKEQPLPKETVEMFCETCKRRFAVPYGANLMVGIRRCEECNEALLKAAAETKTDSSTELKKALGE